MAKLKDNPYDLLKAEDISKTSLNQKSLQSLELYDRAKMLYEKRPNSKEFQDQAEKAGKITCQLIATDIARIKNEAISEADKREKAEVKKAQSKKIVEKSEQVLDDLALCRKRLKEDRQHRIESGEIAPPKKKNLTTKLRTDLLKFATLIPKNLKEDPSVLERTQKALMKFLNELKDIWGLNKIKPIQDELTEKFKKLQEQAA